MLKVKDCFFNNHCAKKGYRNFKALRPALLTAAATVMLAGCASSSSQTASGVHDPFEDANRAVFSFNDAVDRAAIKPVAQGYRALVPKPARKGVTNFLRNLRSPIDFTNQVLQGDLGGAGDVLTRTTANTLLGFGGFVDIAGQEGLEYEREDFGQTLAVWGVGEGPYLVLPLLGPATLRHQVGSMVDTYADPIRLWLFNTDQEEWYYARVGVRVLDERERLLDVLDSLRESSIDYYAAVRSSYIQRRKALINDENGKLAPVPEIPDYDSE